MPLLVRPCHHHRFRAVLNDSFRLRREADEADSAPERDAFDDAASYLVTLDAAGRAIATVRAQPGAGRIAVCGRLADGMDAGLPRGPHVAELSRLCIDPDLSGHARLLVLLELRAGLAELFAKQGWTCGIVLGHDRHIQPFIRSGMTVQVLAPPVLLAGQSQLSFAVLASDPGRPEQAAGLLADDLAGLQDPDEDPSLFTRYGDRAVA